MHILYILHSLYSLYILHQVLTINRDYTFGSEIKFSAISKLQFKLQDLIFTGNLTKIQQRKKCSRAAQNWPTLAEAYPAPFGNWTQHPAMQRVRFRREGSKRQVFVMETLCWKGGGCIEILYCVGRDELLLDSVFIATAHQQYNYAGAEVCLRRRHLCRVSTTRKCVVGSVMWQTASLSYLWSGYNTATCTKRWCEAILVIKTSEQTALCCCHAVRSPSHKNCPVYSDCSVFGMLTMEGYITCFSHFVVRTQ